MGGHEWAVLTCGHIMDCIDKRDNINEAGTFQLNGMIPLPIRSIKIFKRNNRESLMVYNNAMGALAFSPWNSIEFNNLARSIPRFDHEGDVALCYLGNINFGGIPILSQGLLNAQYPIANLNFNPATHQLSFNLANNTVNFHFVNNNPITSNILSGMINGLPKNRNFIIGYTNLILGQTLSTARPVAIALYLNFIDIPNITTYNFFHDAPSYPGMSGGPIFHFTPAPALGINNIVHVYGVVSGSNFNGIGVAAMPSRCLGSFLQENLLQ